MPSHHDLETYLHPHIDGAGMAQDEKIGSWSRIARGLPKKESFFTVQRDAMDIDELKSPALYFGTTTGQLWMGRDGAGRAHRAPRRDIPHLRGRDQ
jgi:hypothetical protein